MHSSGHKKYDALKNERTLEKLFDSTGLGYNRSVMFPEIKAYNMRWLILFLFVMYSASNAFQWTQLVIITNILEKYYNVSTFAVSWTSMLFMVTYIPLIFPASWLLQTKVLKCLDWLWLKLAIVDFA